MDLYHLIIHLLLSNNLNDIIHFNLVATMFYLQKMVLVHNILHLVMLLLFHGFHLLFLPKFLFIMEFLLEFLFTFFLRFIHLDPLFPLFSLFLFLFLLFLEQILVQSINSLSHVIILLTLICI